MQKKYTEHRSILITIPDAETISTSAEINAPASKVWSIVGDFSGFHNFIDGLERIEMTGEGIRSVRKKYFEDGNIVLEQLNTIDNKNMVMTWSLIYTTLDINNLWSAMYVHEINERTCKVTWDIAGEPYSKDTKKKDFEQFISGFASAALENVKQNSETANKAA